MMSPIRQSRVTFNTNLTSFWGFSAKSRKYWGKYTITATQYSMGNALNTDPKTITSNGLHCAKCTIHACENGPFINLVVAKV